ncbi:MAG: hypothetical protein S4CHLAM20_12850 [Chlamydiia bacterium]|nr:hypothetical protein [Chlamydiia bacterium]
MLNKYLLRISLFFFGILPNTLSCIDLALYNPFSEPKIEQSIDFHPEAKKFEAYIDVFINHLKLDKTDELVIFRNEFLPCEDPKEIIPHQTAKFFLTIPKLLILERVLERLYDTCLSKAFITHEEYNIHYRDFVELRNKANELPIPYNCKNLFQEIVNSLSKVSLMMDLVKVDKSNKDFAYSRIKELIADEYLLINEISKALEVIGEMKDLNHLNTSLSNVINRFIAIEEVDLLLFYITAIDSNRTKDLCHFFIAEQLLKNNQKTKAMEMANKLSNDSMKKQLLEFINSKNNSVQ